MLRSFLPVRWKILSTLLKILTISWRIISIISGVSIFKKSSGTIHFLSSHQYSTVQCLFFQHISRSIWNFFLHRFRLFPWLYLSIYVFVSLVYLCTIYLFCILSICYFNIVLLFHLFVFLPSKKDFLAHLNRESRVKSTRRLPFHVLKPWDKIFNFCKTLYYNNVQRRRTFRFTMLSGYLKFIVHDFLMF